MNGNLKNIMSYIKEAIELKNKNVYDVKDYLLAIDYDEFCKKYGIEKKDNLSIFSDGIIFKMSYISEKEKKTYPKIPFYLQDKISIVDGYIKGNEGIDIGALERNQEYSEFKKKYDEIYDYNKSIDEYNDYYMKFYNYYKRIVDYEDKMEFILGTNLLYWKGKEGEVIKRPILEAVLDVNVDPFTNTISFTISNEMNKGLVTDFLNYKTYVSKDKGPLYDYVDEVNESILEKKDINLKEVVTSYASLVAVENEVSDDNFQDRKKLKSGVTYIFNNKYIIVRNKNAKLWVEDLNKIIDTCDKEEIKSPILNLLDVDFNDEEAVKRLLNADGSDDGEVLFPLLSNDEQYKIIDRVRKSNLVLVQGPPGTGKSHTIANLISHFISEGKRVVVTSEKAKALEVIREKLPEEIRCLSLALLTNKGIDKELEYSVDTVLKKQSTADRLEIMFLKIGKMENELKTLRLKKEDNNKKIIELRQYDSVSKEDALKEILNGKVVDYTLCSIAKWLKENEKFRYIPIEDNETIEYPDLTALFYNLNLLAGDIEEEKYVVTKRVIVKEYLTDNTISQVIMGANNASLYEVKNSNLQDVIRFKNLTIEKIDNLKNKVQVLNKINENFSKDWILDNIKYNVFIVSLEELKKELNEFRELVYVVESNKLEYTIDYDSNKREEYINNISNILDNFGNGEEASFICKKIKCKNAFTNINNIKVSSILKEVNFYNREFLLIIKNALEYDRRVNNIREILNKLFNKDIFKLLDISNESFGKGIDKLINFLDSFINYNSKVKEIDDDIKQVINTELLDISYSNKDVKEINDILDDLEFYATRDSYQQRIKDIIDIINEDYKEDNLKYLKNYILAIRNTDLDGYMIYKDKVLNEIDIINKYQNLKDTYPYFFQDKKKFMYSYIYEYDEDERMFITNNIQNILLYHYVDRYYNQQEEKLKLLPDLYATREDLIKQEKDKIISLVALKGWYNQIKNMTTSITSSLGRWLNLKKKYGAGTSKNANLYLKQMQEEMKTSKDAIPVWIMPVEKLIEQYPYSNEAPFDVLIMDESSQSSVLSVSALTRGKKVIIVGDDKQISPISVGISNEAMNDLRIKYLQDNAWKYILTYNTSIYDIVQTVCSSKKIVLTEHFRCLPEIINYSRYQFYNGDINPLKVRSRENTITKPIETVYVPEAVCKRIGVQPYNEKEIEMVVDLVGEMLADKQYDNKTIGVITLQNSNRQIQKISELLMQEFGEKVILERHIKVGDSYDFQGDERDVIILSMVVAKYYDNGDKYPFAALTKKDFDQSFNVAASRAKEQMILVHSVKLEDLNPICNRYKLLEYCLHYDKEKKVSNDELFKTTFEKDFYYTLKQKGLLLTPQYKVGKYILDFMMENTKGQKIAIMCDGDEVVTSEMAMDDLKQQSILERCGWEFVRVRASEYYYDEDKCLLKFIQKMKDFLQEEEIGSKKNISIDEIGMLFSTLYVNDIKIEDIAKYCHMNEGIISDRIDEVKKKMEVTDDEEFKHKFKEMFKSDGKYVEILDSYNS